MPVTFELREDGHVLYLVITDPWSIEDLTPARAAGRFYRARANHPLHSLTDLRRTYQVPGNIYQLFRDELNMKGPNRGQIVLFGAPPPFATFIQYMLDLVPVSGVRFFDSESVAWLYMRQVIKLESSPLVASHR